MYNGTKNENYVTMTEGVQTFLEDLGLLQYFDMFVIKGFDCEEDLCHIDSADLDSMTIADPDHRRQILHAARRFKPSSEYKLLEWLRANSLDYYFPNFVNSESANDLDQIKTLNLPDPDIFDELEITLPGHKRRLERAVSRLRKRMKTTDQSPEEPIAHGRWAKPTALQDGKFDFLVLDATVYSTKDRKKSHTLEFMIDSGSDVTTIREEVLEGLDLELLGRIHSKGVHGSKSTNLYRAYLRIGNQELQIEVMGESYDSLGSRVVRHFRHFIDGSRHLWLKGDYCDPDMAPPRTVTPSPSESANSPRLRSQSSSSSSYMQSTSSSYRSTSDSLSSSSQNLSQSQSLDASQDITLQPETEVTVDIAVAATADRPQSIEEQSQFELSQDSDEEL
ncbi:uncharacterized protein LOC110446272 [Mizuhopecten yessoensis]|uniref:Ankyrin repeat and SAM domain-containing protein 1A n=1 Tax=Mizuhopecten yessoensis TaxID=6573 RepID=A0A210QXP4_MIZYE|nr:uncharacterized protein LOC110446272 [Mizuhopecten yessoensis]OWF53494.1 Ankyrin repeat and SAM domain-containing protein 1A [Mizuhopecten yessoensis]